MIEITSKSLEGFSDVALTIANLTKDKYNYKIIAKGIFEKKTVALKIILNREIVSAIVNNEIKEDNFSENAVIFESVGLESDRLVAALSKLYKKDSSNIFSTAKVTFSASALKLSGFDFEKDLVKLQLYYNNQNIKNSQAQFYMNINIPEKEIITEEKHQVFRENIIRLLTK